MKKLLLSIFGIFLGLSAFCSAELFSFSQTLISSIPNNKSPTFTLSVSSGYTYLINGFLLFSCTNSIYPDDYVSVVLSGFNNNNFSYSEYASYSNYRVYLVTFDPILIDQFNPFLVNYHFHSSCSAVYAPRFVRDYFSFSFVGYLTEQSFVGGVDLTPVFSSSSSSDITVFYDYGHSSTTISCNGDNSIFINGMSFYSGVTFSPYFNINYVDQDNQIITESYSNDILYLSDGKFHKSYTGNNQWILSVVSDSDSFFTGYLPTFVVTGNITELNTGNVFNNFAENSLTVLLSNVPNYIQYVIMFMLLLFILSIFRKLR